MAIGLALTIIHFTTEVHKPFSTQFFFILIQDILGLEKAKKKYFEAQKTAEAQVVFKSNSINLSEIKDDPDQLTKYTAVCFENNNFLVIFFKLRVQESMLEDYGVDIPSITINPLDLPFFMASTIGKSKLIFKKIIKILSCVIWNCLYVNRDNVVENRSRQRKSEEQRITNCIERFVCEIKSKLVFFLIQIIISYLIPFLTKQETIKLTSSNPTMTPPTMPMMTKYDSIWDSQEASMRISVVF